LRHQLRYVVTIFFSISCIIFYFNFKINRFSLVNLIIYVHGHAFPSLI
jgi:hypothetical protein